jgi:hypothetical protein
VAPVAGSGHDAARSVNGADMAKCLNTLLFQYSLGIPKDSILKYETALKTDKFVLIAHGSIDEINRAKEILHWIDSEALEQHQ